MKTKGALLWGTHQDWSVEEIELGDPVTSEVQVQLAATGLCHSDEHLVTGGEPHSLPCDRRPRRRRHRDQGGAGGDLGRGR